MVLRVKLHVPAEGSFPFPLKQTTLGVMSEKSIEDYWNADGDRELRDTWIGSTRFTISSEKPPDGYTWPGRLTRKETTSRPDKFWPEMWKHMSEASKRKEKQKMDYRETKARKCQTIAWYLLH